MNHNWYIGQDIVCIKSHSMGIVKEGDVRTIKGLTQGCCKVRIDVGALHNNYVTTMCCECGSRTSNNNNVIWLSENLFAPLDTLTDISEIEEILSQPVESLFQI